MKDVQVKLPLPDTWLDEASDQELIKAVLEQIAKDADGGMSHFQITNFVLSDKEFPTIGAKYFQAKREIATRYHNLINQHFEYQKVMAESDIKAVEHEEYAQNPSKLSQAKAKLASIECQQLVMRADFVKLEAKRQIRELKSFWMNHEFYGKLLKPGVTRELTEPEHWMEKTKQKGKVGKEISQHLAGPFQEMRETICGEQLMMDAKEAGLLVNGHPRERLDG